MTSDPYSGEKQLAWEAYWEGFKLGRNVESYSEQTLRTAMRRFERYWEGEVA